MFPSADHAHFALWHKLYFGAVLQGEAIKECRQDQVTVGRQREWFRQFPASDRERGGEVIGCATIMPGKLLLTMVWSDRQGECV